MAIFGSSKKSTKSSSKTSLNNTPNNTQSNTAPVINITDNSKVDAYKSAISQGGGGKGKFNVTVKQRFTDYGAIDKAFELATNSQLESNKLVDKVLGITEKTLKYAQDSEKSVIGKLDGALVRAQAVQNGEKVSAQTWIGSVDGWVTKLGVAFVVGGGLYFAAKAKG